MPPRSALHAGNGIAPNLLGVIPREKGSPRWPASRRVVELGEPQPAGGEPVQVGRLDLAAVAAQVGEAQVIGEDDDDVGSRRPLGATG